VSRDTLIKLIDPDPEQPRKVFDEVTLAELAESIAATGLAVPILLRPAPDGRFLIVHGERRWRAAQRLGWETIPAEVRELSPDEAHWLSLVENVQRSDLSPIEEAHAYQGRLEAGLTQEALARRLGKDRTYIAQKLRLLTLPLPLQYYLSHRALGEGHARQLLRIRGLYGEVFPQKCPLREAPEVDAANLWELIRETRPADWPVVYGLLRHATKTPPALVLFASNLFVRGWGQRQQIPAWEVAAFWWASAAVLLELSVAVLAKVLTDWWDGLVSAIALVELDSEGATRPDPPGRDPHAHLAWYEYWGYRSDLRHARLLGALETGQFPTARRREARDRVLRVSSAAYPSECQPGGPHHQAYTEALRAVEAAHGA
jgi:ParB/RepB/Spo0J family partition protein